MALDTLDELIAGLAEYGVLPFYKWTATAKGAGYWHSLWTCVGNPVAGSAPGSTAGIIPTKATAGALQFANADAGETTYIAQLSDGCAVTGTLIFYDRLWTNSGLVGNVATAQTWTQPALTRHTDGVGVEAWLEVYTALGSTAVTATLTYTDSDGNTGNTCTTAVNATAIAGQIIPFGMAAGDKGIRATSQVQLSATTGTAGNFGITLLKRKATISIPVANIGNVMDIIDLASPIVDSNACIAMMQICTGTSTGTHLGTYSIISK